MFYMKFLSVKGNAIRFVRINVDETLGEKLLEKTNDGNATSFVIFHYVVIYKLNDIVAGISGKCCSKHDVADIFFDNSERNKKR